MPAIGLNQSAPVEKKKTGFQEWEVSDALYTLTSFERSRRRAEEIRANKPLMREVAKLAKKRLEEEKRDTEMLGELAKQAG